MFSTFMLTMLAEIYSTFPEEGDLDYPKLAIFIDEAHIMFEEASDELMDQIEMIIKLIRSKGVGIFFCTQTPRDIPESVLSQLGMKIQHALRAFTAKDRKSIKLLAENYPESKFYNTENILTSLGIGEAFITVLNEKGIPTPLVATLLKAPRSRMDILNDSEIDEILTNSNIIDRYNEVIDRESAYEILEKKIDDLKQEEKQQQLQQEHEKMINRAKKDKKEKSFMDSTVGRQIGRTLAREVTRGILGVLGLGGSSSGRKKGSKTIGWF